MGEGQLEMGVGPVSTVHPVIIDEIKGGVLPPPLSLNSLYSLEYKVRTALNPQMFAYVYTTDSILKRLRLHTYI